MRCAALALLCALPLAGCNSISLPSLSSADNALASLANNDLPAACGIVNVAAGYFDALKPKISPQNRLIEAKAVAAVAVICANPPKDTAAAISSLFAAWSAIQAATVTN